MRKNYKFTLSTIVPTEWFQKLKNMTKLKRKQSLPPFSLNITKKKRTKPSDFKSLPYSSPRNSLHMIQSKRKTLYKPSPSPSSASSVSTGFKKNNIHFLPKQDSSESDIIIDFRNRGFKKNVFKEIKEFDQTMETLNTHELSVKVNNREKERIIEKKHPKTLSFSRRRRQSPKSPRIKLKVNSPRIQVSARRSQSRQVLDSYGVIKNSLDPKKDFKESMVEMIQENNIKSYKDLEDLLECYLSLNHKEYHHLIINAFVQVWLEVIKSVPDTVFRV